MSVPFILAPGKKHPDAPPLDRPFFRFASGQTGGLAALAEVQLPPLTAGPNLHVHTREDELFFVLDGVMTVQVGDRLQEIAAGGLAWGARGTPPRLRQPGKRPAPNHDHVDSRRSRRALPGHERVSANRWRSSGPAGGGRSPSPVRRHARRPADSHPPTVTPAPSPRQHHAKARATPGFRADGPLPAGCRGRPVALAAKRAWHCEPGTDAAAHHLMIAETPNPLRPGAPHADGRGPARHPVTPNPQPIQGQPLPFGSAVGTQITQICTCHGVEPSGPSSRAERRLASAIRIMLGSVTEVSARLRLDASAWPPRCGQAEFLPVLVLPGSAREIGGDDVGGMPVQAAAGTVVPHRGPGIGVRGGFLHIPQRHPGI